MLITRECDYAVRVIRALAGETKLSVNEICEREAITVPFAYKILKKLQKVGIVQGFRGVNGGYSMKMQLGELTLYDVYRAVNPDLFIIECMDSVGYCIRDGQNGIPCEIRKELAAIQKELWGMLQRKNLAELLKCIRESRSEKELFFIENPDL